MKINLERIYKNKEELLNDISELERNIPRKTRGNLSKNKKKEIKRIRLKIIKVIYYIRVYMFLKEKELDELEMKSYNNINLRLSKLYTEKFEKKKKTKKEYKSFIQMSRKIDEKADILYKNYEEYEIEHIRKEYNEILDMLSEREIYYPKKIEKYIVEILEKVYLTKKEKIDNFSNKYDEYLKKEKINNTKYTTKDEVLKIVNDGLKVFGTKYLNIVKEAFNDEKINIAEDIKKNMIYSGYIFVEKGKGIYTINTLLHELRTLGTR